jgi:F-type H+-transporting ATPase subunit delta
MSELRVASRYAKSLLELAVEKKILEEVNKDMRLFDKVLQENRPLLLMLRNPVIKNDKKAAVLGQVFKGKINALTSAFFDLVSRKNREAALPAIAQEFFAQYNVHNNILKAQVTTTFPLTDDLRKRFQTTLVEATGKTIELEENVNPELIGGFILKIGDKQVDESLKSKLKEMKLKFKEDAYIKKY